MTTKLANARRVFVIEYSPFGEVLRATGPMAALNPCGWSTKVTDRETGLVYYGYRYYDPSTGRWIGRDSAGEQNGGNNLFVFCNNSPFNFVDNDGRIATAAYWWNVMYTMEKGIIQAAAKGEDDTVERLEGLWSQACNQFGKACVSEEAVGGIAEGFDEGTALLGGVAIGPLAVC
jgi:RHS repeat-associated protein